MRNESRGSASMYSCIFALILACGVSQGAADPLNFSPTTVPSSWQVTTNVGGVDGELASFPTSGFAPAVAIDARTGWIANNSTGTNSGLGDWTFFVFRQTFDLTGYIPTSANLQFQWAADDSGQVFATRGELDSKISA